MSRGKRITARGCLQEAGADLYLIQDDGTRVEVTGAKLDEYKGHEAEVGGERRSRTIAISVSGCGVQCGAASGNHSQKLQRPGSQLEQDIQLKLSIHFGWCLRCQAI